MTTSLLQDVDHVVWDWNGTLLDDHAHCVDVLNAMLRKKSLPEIDGEKYRAYFDFPVKRYYERLGFDVGPAEWEDLATFFITTYDGGVEGCALAPRARDVLTALRARGKTSSILSAARKVTLEPLLATHGIRDFFTEVVGLDDHYARGKLELAVGWMRSSAVAPARTLFVGDTVHDFEVATAMGVRPVLVAAGHQSRERLEACGCPVIDDLGALVVP
ncbi:MAG TPA: HAD family hydrolase [Polyangiaceae bacterium]|nr:HAD family hydrolase [Polyangiaceae bacterium]